MRGEFVKAAAARLLAVVSGLVGGLVSLKLYGHFLTPSAYGIIAVALQVINYLPMLDGGFRTATNRRLLACEPDERQSLVLFAQTVYSWLLLLGLVCGTAAMLGYAVIRGDQSAWSPQLSLLLGLVGAVSMYAGAQAGLLLGLGSQALLGIVNGIATLTGVAALAGSFSLGLGLWAFPASIACSATMTYSLALLFLQGRGIEIPPLRFKTDTQFWRRFRVIRGEAWGAFRAQVSILFLYSADLIVVSFFCDPAEVAIYGIASRFLTIGRGLLQVLNESAWPFVAAKTVGSDRFHDGLIRVNAWLYGLAGACAAIALPIFISWYVGKAWRPSSSLTWLLVIRFLVVGLANPPGYYLFGRGKFSRIAVLTERELFLSVAFGLVLGPLWAANGVALAFLIGTTAGTLFPYWNAFAQEREQGVAGLLIAVWWRAATTFSLVIGSEMAWRAFT
ncbi:MAG: oligosaccharide flippase family protein [Chthoniobacterales bacterium]